MAYRNPLLDYENDRFYCYVDIKEKTNCKSNILWLYVVSNYDQSIAYYRKTSNMSHTL